MVFANTKPALKILKSVDHAVVPKRANRAAVGFDVFSSEGVTIMPKSVAIIKTGIRALPPPGAYIRITGRSGLSARGFFVQTGVIDPDFTGEIGILMYNSTDEPAYFRPFSRVAQLVPELYAQYCEVVQVDALAFTCAAVAAGDRGAEGFGSTGD